MADDAVPDHGLEGLRQRRHQTRIHRRHHHHLVTHLFGVAAIAADDAFFMPGYIRIGANPDGSGTYFLPRTVGMKKAMEILMLGDRFDAATASRLGIVNRVVPVDDLAAETQELAQRLASGPTHAIANTKELLNASLGNTLETQLASEAVSFSECAATDDWAEGVTAFAEKRKPVFRGK